MFYVYRDGEQTYILLLNNFILYSQNKTKNLELFDLFQTTELLSSSGFGSTYLLKSLFSERRTERQISCNVKYSVS